MEAWIEDLLQKGIDVDSGMSYTGKGEQYRKALQRFFEAHESVIGNVKGFHSARDAENFTILVHSVKSNAKMIGAKVLSQKALELEQLGKAAAWADIDSLMRAFLEEYLAAIEIIRPALSENEGESPDGASAKGQAQETARKLLQALEDFDDEESSRLLTELMEYPFPAETHADLLKARDLAEEFMYDEAAELVGQALPQIGD